MQHKLVGVVLKVWSTWQPCCSAQKGVSATHVFILTPHKTWCVLNDLCCRQKDLPPTRQVSRTQSSSCGTTGRSSEELNMATLLPRSRTTSNYPSFTLCSVEMFANGKWKVRGSNTIAHRHPAWGIFFCTNSGGSTNYSALITLLVQLLQTYFT